MRTRHNVRSDRALFRDAVLLFFALVSFSLSLSPARFVFDTTALRSLSRENRPFRVIRRIRTIGDKHKTLNRAHACALALSRPRAVSRRTENAYARRGSTHDLTHDLTRTQAHTHTHMYIHANPTQTHTTRVHAYTAYKMNARRHTLGDDRTKLATGVLTYRQIGLPFPSGGNSPPR